MEEIARAVAELLGEAPVELRPVAGGDIGLAFRARLGGGESLFVKAYSGPDAGPMVDAEARGLAWLGEAGAVRVPEVRASAARDPFALLVLEWIESASGSPEGDEALGRGLARLHAAGAPGFGFEADNFVGRLPQSNRPAASWAEFYGERRLRPLLSLARGQGRISRRADALADALLERLPGLVGPEEAPARLHGDLWGGNRLCAAGGEPVLIDPAVYGGHREIDLAMMRLFGGFSERAFAAYEEVAPLAPGHEVRLPLYQLTPLLVHLVLFGSGYAAGVEGALRAALAEDL